MRITIGHVLIIGGVAGLLILGPFSKINFSKAFSKLEKINLPDSIKNYVPFQNQKKNGATAPLTQVLEPAPVVPAAPPPVVETPPTPEPVIEKPAPVKAVKTRKRRRKSKAAVPAVKAAPVAKAAPAKKNAAGGDELIGTYVAVSLKTGREVKGIYQSKTATHYVIELPGMGPFEYPIENVSTIKPAE